MGALAHTDSWISHIENLKKSWCLVKAPVVKTWWRTCFRAHLSDVMRCESHLSRGPVFRRGVIDKSCANCIYWICQLALCSGVPGPVQRAGGVFAAPLTFVMLSWGLLFDSSENHSSITSFQGKRGTGRKETVGSPTRGRQGSVKHWSRVQCAAWQGQTTHALAPKEKGEALGLGSPGAVGWVCSVVWNSEPVTDSTVLVLLVGTWQVHSESRRSRHLRTYPEIRTVLLGDSFPFYWSMLIKTW